MYEAFYGLRERPFDVTANPDFLVLTHTHEEALSNLEYGITSGRGITLLVGEAGSGKTTLLRKALARVEGTGTTVRLAWLMNPVLSRREFVEFLAASFELSEAAAVSKTRLVFELDALLRHNRPGGDISLLVVDEAQSLSHELLEEVRLLTNIETDKEKLLTVVLAGQPELATRLNNPALRQLKQRVVLRCTIAPLTLLETARYITKRILVAGGDPGQIFSREAVVEIWRHARGIPRTVNVICDNALLTGFALDRRPVDVGVISEVCADFDLRPAAGVAAPATAAPAPAAAQQNITRFVRPAAVSTPHRWSMGLLRRRADR